MLIKNYLREISMKQFMYYCNIKYINAFCKECSNYNKVWTCPPHNIDVIDMLKEYNQCYLVATKIYTNDLPQSIQSLVDNDPYNIILATEAIMKDVRNKLDKVLLNVENHIPQSRAILSGKCLLCDMCSRVSDKPCRNPDMMRYSLESFGFDISRICQEIFGIEILWGGYTLPKYIILVSGIMTKESKNSYNEIMKNEIPNQW
ncbi:DUF2284 domain-containing protein [Haloimpatiens sp. FM7330]|uniref:DUF2284 domain-containing protein n=1 Tax=Haloimpatiens sp. FM7330 TaxID=3298610 RepID=UPI00363F52D5